MLSITVKTQFEGFHRYIDAPEEVKFLSYPHRHIFYVEAEFEVDHNDRDLEFFIMKRKIDKIIKNYITIGNAGSCEMIAERIADKLQEFPLLKISVSEDNENYATYYLNK